MGAFNYLHFEGKCPQCGFEGRLRAEFKMGQLEIRDYGLGDELDWDGEYGYREHDPPVTGYMADYGYAECPRCGTAHWVWITVEGNRLVRVELSPGPDRVPFDEWDPDYPSGRGP